MSNLIIGIVTVIALIIGPSFSVWLGLRLQDRKIERNIKHSIFLTLMANRKVDPPNERQVESLNMLDVAFRKHPTILALWHNYFESLCIPNPAPAQIILQKKNFLDLLHEIGMVLGYEPLLQSNIEIYYEPRGLADAQSRMSAILDRLLSVLNNTEALVVKKKNDELS